MDTTDGRVGRPAGARQRRFLVLHGLTNRRPPEHWQHLLTLALRDSGEQVVYPQLPDTDAPHVDSWLEVLDAELAMLGDPEEVERVVVAHSLGAVLWLHACARGVQVPVERVLLVAPPGRAETRDRIPSFPLPASLTAASVAAAAGSTLLVASDHDDWCAAGAHADYGTPLALPTVIVPGGGHLNIPAGYGRWDDVEAWCRDPASVWAGSRPPAVGFAEG